LEDGPSVSLPKTGIITNLPGKLPADKPTQFIKQSLRKNFAHPIYEASRN